VQIIFNDGNRIPRAIKYNGIDRMNEFEFQDPCEMADGDLHLVLIAKHPANPDKKYVPAYEFEMKNVDGETMGAINLRIGNNRNIQYGGHIGYGVKREYRGSHYAARSVQLLLPLAKSNGLAELLITCSPENIASKRSCELANAEYVDTVKLPKDNEMYQEGDRKKSRYRIRLS
jgi:predicted acetyltransferase